MIVPSKIKVGFQKRSDTYTGKLGYVIYYDNKNKLRKETSFNKWINKDIETVEFDNVPVEGFVINKGNTGRSWSDFERNPFVRIYDPRGFEFEINLGNLILILQYCDCHKGKGISGELAYGWDGTQLYLLPKTSPEYKEGYKTFSAERKNIKVKDLAVGTVLGAKSARNKKVYTYLGRIPIDKLYITNDILHDAAVKGRPVEKSQVPQKNTHLFHVSGVSRYGSNINSFHNILLSKFDRVIDTISTDQVDELMETFNKSQFDYSDLVVGYEQGSAWSQGEIYKIDNKNFIYVRDRSKKYVSITDSGITCRYTLDDTTNLEMYRTANFVNSKNGKTVAYISYW